MKTQFSLEDLGCDEFFESKRKELNLDGFGIGRVTAEFRGAYRVKNEKGEYLGKITGRRIFNASGREDFPVVGDWVAISVADQEHAVIQTIFPRKTIIKRRRGKDREQVIATNVDAAFIVQALDRDYNLNRFERYFSLARDGGVKPVIILNKADLAPKEGLDSIRAEITGRFPGVDYILTSTVTNDGLKKLEEYI
ncbi:MAG: GTPase RsgA [Candidatus Nealsonbacteria bacterium]|nr:GTPase RsgA [Candidatus Nealsonbacteria bacterium]